MPATLIALEGIDGAGKGTQTARLVQYLAQNGRRVALFSFPRYAHTLYGSFIGDYLNGRFGQLNTIDPLLASLLFAGDRLESRSLLCEAIAANDYVICDRYVASNIAYQSSRRSNPERQQIMERIEAIEYGVHQLPRPDLNIWLDLTVSRAKELISAKSRRVYTEQAEDLHESDTSFLEAVRTIYRELASQPGWKTIDCEQAGELKTVERIAAEIQQAVQHLL